METIPQLFSYLESKTQEDGTVTDGVINITKVTGAITITATATPSQP